MQSEWTHVVAMRQLTHMMALRPKFVSITSLCRTVKVVFGKN
jgi:hypothetical protein